MEVVVNKFNPLAYINLPHERGRLEDLVVQQSLHVHRLGIDFNALKRRRRRRDFLHQGLFDVLLNVGH